MAFPLPTTSGGPVPGSSVGIYKRTPQFSTIFARHRLKGVWGTKLSDGTPFGMRMFGHEVSIPDYGTDLAKFDGVEIKRITSPEDCRNLIRPGLVDCSSRELSVEQEDRNDVVKFKSDNGYLSIEYQEKGQGNWKLAGLYKVNLVK